MTCVAFSIKFAKTNQKFAENSEFCENYSLLFKIIHFTPYSAGHGRARRDDEADALQRRGAHSVLRSLLRGWPVDLPLAEAIATLARFYWLRNTNSMGSK